MLEEYYGQPEEVVQYGHGRHEKPEYMEFHMHDLFEIYYFISGDVNYFIENKVFRLKYGDLLVMNSTELHRASFLSDAPYERITVHFYPEAVRELSSPRFDLMECFTGRKKGERNKITLTASKIHEIEELFRRLQNISSREAAEGNDVLRLACFMELLVFVNKAFKSCEGDTGGHTVPERLEPLFRYIDENLDGDLSLAVLSARTYTDKYYLSRLFKSSTGMNIQDYILYKRIFKAKELLSRGMNVMEVCQNSGFNDYSNFIRTFKKLTGISPGKYGMKFRTRAKL
jgi:AraC-like DNA-binding protein